MIKIGELSNITGISIQTIRFYESEGLFSPVEVDRWTNYRYYDESSIERLYQISHLKQLGFSLKEIKNLSEDVIKNKIKQVELDIKKLTKNIDKLSAIRKNEGGFSMENFINDERVIGKWKKLAVVEKVEDFALNKFADDEIFDFKELYFLPNGEDYWVFYGKVYAWTKGTLYLMERPMPYEIIDGKLYIGVVDGKTNTIDNYAIYEKIDNKSYKKEEIRVKDNVDLPFINDEQVIGFWETVDYVHEFEDFIPGQKFWSEDLFLKEYIFKPNGSLLMSYNTIENIDQINWTKGVVISERQSTASAYTLKTIDNEQYMFVEWKSGDYVFGGEVFGYYVLKKIK